MSASVTLSPYIERRAGAGPSRFVPFSRLVFMEIRKLVDTRTARVLLGLLLIGGLAAMFARASFLSANFGDVLSTSAVALGLFLPVLGIVSVTSEWNKRTALTTFALEPRRWRVLVAKLFAGAAVAVAASVLMIAAAYPVTAAGATILEEEASFTFDGALLAGWTASQVLVTLSGIALGTVLLNAIAAIIVYFAAAVAWSLAAVFGDLGSTLARWLDLTSASIPLATGDMSWTSTAPLATAICAWVALPFLLGVIRVSGTEIR